MNRDATAPSVLRASSRLTLDVSKDGASTTSLCQSLATLIINNWPQTDHCPEVTRALQQKYTERGSSRRRSPLCPQLVVQGWFSVLLDGCPRSSLALLFQGIAPAARKSHSLEMSWQQWQLCWKTEVRSECLWKWNCWRNQQSWGQKLGSTLEARECQTQPYKWVPFCSNTVA